MRKIFSHWILEPVYDPGMRTNVFWSRPSFRPYRNEKSGEDLR